MRCISAAVVAMLAVAPAGAESVPLPKERPASQNGRTAPAPLPLAPAVELKDVSFGSLAASPSACDRRRSELAQFTPMQGVVGPGECGAADVVRLDAGMMRDRTRVPLNPPAVLRCQMAEAVAHFLRDDVAPAAAELGGALSGIVNYNSYECRGRNRVAGARISEHGKGNAIDIRGIRLGNGTVVDWTSPIVTKDFRERIRLAACDRFNTVLGPGSDSYHESHIHLDLIQRRGGYRMCQWAVREPGEAPPPAVARKLPKFTPVQHADGAAVGVIPPPPSSPRGRAAQSASCRADQACPPEASPRQARAPRRAAARRSEVPLVMFRW